MVAKSILNTWFTTRSQPTQEQFWEWQDSYWHKEDAIPLSSIEGLGKTLSFFATRDQLSGLATTAQVQSEAQARAEGDLALQSELERNYVAKASMTDVVRTDATGKVPLALLPLRDEVREFASRSAFPSAGLEGVQYIALDTDTIWLWDAASGTYKEAGASDLQLAGKLDKPTTGLTNPGNYSLVLVNENGQSAKMPADSLGQNVATSNLTSTLGAGLNLGADWYVQTGGRNYGVKGLAERSTDTTYSKKIVVNEDGTFGLSDRNEIQFIYPTESSIQVNHLFPSTDINVFPQEIVSLLRSVSSKTYTPLGETDIVGYVKSDATDNTNVFSTGVRTTGGAIGDQIRGGWNIFTRSLPSDKDWILDLNLRKGGSFHPWGSIQVGLYQGPNTSWDTVINELAQVYLADDTKTDTPASEQRLLIIHAGNVINMICIGKKIFTYAKAGMDDLGPYRIAVNGGSRAFNYPNITSLSGKVWIQP